MEYIRSLSPVARERYVAKLATMGLAEREGPYSNISRFIDDMIMTSWPPVEYGHIYGYFIQRPGVYTHQQLLQWKSLEAYNYFKSGHVREVRVWIISKAFSVLIARVNPSQNSPDKAHHTWICVQHDGIVITAHCTCIAG